MHNTLPNTCLIVPTYSPKSKEIINSLICSLNRQSITAIDLIIVNNNAFPIDVSESLIKGSVYIINWKKNLWSAGWFYLWMKYAYNKKYDFYILWDDDAVLIDGDLLEELVNKTKSTSKHVYRPCWKELSEDCDPKGASISCFGCFDHSILSEFWFYDPFFFYWWEDSVFSERLVWWNVVIRDFLRSFSHPLKRWLSPGWTWGLSVFIHNNLLQNIWFIFFAPIRKKIKAFFVGFLYLAFCFFWAAFFRSIFRKQMLMNLRNMIMYIPPVLFQGEYGCFYPKYKKMESGNLVTLDGSFDFYSDSESTDNNADKRKLVFDDFSWLSISGIKKLLSINFLKIAGFYVYDSMDESGSKMVREFLRVGTWISKLARYCIMVCLIPIIVLFAGIFYFMLIVKYAIIFVFLRQKEEKMFQFFTSKI